MDVTSHNTHVCLSLSFRRMVALLKRDLNAKSAAKVAQAQQSALERVFAGQHGAKTA